MANLMWPASTNTSIGQLTDFEFGTYTYNTYIRIILWRNHVWTCNLDRSINKFLTNFQNYNLFSYLRQTYRVSFALIYANELVKIEGLLIWRIRTWLDVHKIKFHIKVSALRVRDSFWSRQIFLSFNYRHLTRYWLITLVDPENGQMGIWGRYSNWKINTWNYNILFDINRKNLFFVLIIAGTVTFILY